MKFESLLPYVSGIIGVIIGWFLSELSSWFRDKRSERMVISKALSELLEIRHIVLRLPEVTSYIMGLFGGSSSDRYEMELLFKTFLPSSEELRSRYQQAVDDLAYIDPASAFQIRDYAFIVSYFDSFRETIVSNPSDSTIIKPFEQFLLTTVKKTFDESIKNLASRIGGRTKKDALQSLRLPSVKETLTSDEKWKPLLELLKQMALQMEVKGKEQDERNSNNVG